MKNRIRIIFRLVKDKQDLTTFHNYYYTHFRTKKSRVWNYFIIFDFIKCTFLYGTGIGNYFNYEFYKKNRYERKKFVTDGIRSRYWDILQKDKSIDLTKKHIMYNMYRSFLGRDFIYVCENSKDTFLAFCKDKKRLFAKHNQGKQGVGARKIDIFGNSNFDKLYEELVDGDYVVEEFIEQHEEMAQFHPFSLNTFRITTIIKDNYVHVISAVIRMGNEKQVVDNYSSGGIVASIDINSGLISSAGISQKTIEKFLFHPITDKQIIGFKIPLWDEIIELALKMAIVNSDIGYVGWDIALSKKGPVLVEANFRGGFNLQQSPLQIGLKELYDKIVFGK